MPAGGSVAKAQAQMRGHLDLDISYASGEFTQQLQQGEALQVGSVQFTGPGPVEVSTDVLTADLSTRIERCWPNGLAIGGRFGLRFMQLDITLRSSPQFLGITDDAQVDSLGALAGFEGSYEPSERLRLYIAYSGSLGIPLEGSAYLYENIKSQTLDLGGSWTLFEHVRLLGGWRRLRYKADSAEDFQSDIDIVLSGPFVGLWMVF